VPASPDIARFLERLPPKLAARFDDEQLAAVELHFGMRNRVRHAIDWRKRVLGAYVVVLAGRDRKAD
jgi:hypothetical protein